MEPRLIQIGDTLINPAHVAYVERHSADCVYVHMAVGVFQGRGMNGMFAGGTDHPLLGFNGADAAAVWAALGGVASKQL